MSTPIPKIQSEQRIYGLIGKSLPHSFSPDYFAQKFINENILNTKYLKWELAEITELIQLLYATPFIQGFNVTIPYKEQIIPLLDELDPIASETGAVNTVKIEKQAGRKYTDFILKGYNTDVLGFRDSLKPILKAGTERALVLGSGGSSKAICFVLRSLGIKVLQVSRNPHLPEQIAWSDLNESIIHYHPLIINTTPVGQFPITEEAPPIPWQYLGHSHILYDLIYNPEETLFLKRGREKGAQIQNGYAMLCLQAEYSWKIWQNGY